MASLSSLRETDIYQRLRWRARAIKYARRIDPCEIRFMRKALKPGELAIDIGAHKGGYVYWMQKAVTSSGKVLAFEPQSKLAEYLNHVMAICGLGHVEIVFAAVSNVVGWQPLFSPAERVSTGATLVGNLFPENDSVVQVSTTTLDEYLSKRSDLQPPKYIKIDVETHELEVLEGGQEVLRSAQPAIQIEADQHVYGERPISDIFEFMASLDFVGFFFFNRKLRPLREFDLSIHQPPEKSRTPNHPGFANNFIFLHRDKEGQILRQCGISR